MVQIIKEASKKPSFMQKLGDVSQSSLNKYDAYVQRKNENEALKQLTGLDFEGIQDPEIRNKAFQLGMQASNRAKEFSDEINRNRTIIKDLEDRRQLPSGSLAAYENDVKMAEQVSRPDKEKAPVGGLGGTPLTPEESQAIENVLAQNPNASAEQLEIAFGKAGIAPGRITNFIESRRRNEENKPKSFESERTYHTSFSRESEKQANQLRESIPKKENALDYARNAVETGDVSFFSKDKLADSTGLDVFRTAKGAQLVTAGKENLLSNMGRVGAKAQNIWFEQRLNSMFAKIGQSEEANLTVQEMLEGELALDKAYLEEFDRMSSQDEEKLGYVRKDIEKRVHDNIKPLEKEIFKRSTFRMREIEERELGLTDLKKSVGKNVPKGTPLTMAMAKLYKDKFGNTALQVAEKNGYYIPTIEEFRRFQENPREFRENLNP